MIITLNNQEFPFRCNMYVISKLLQKKKMTSPDEMLSSLGHLELVEIFYESVKAGCKKESKPFKLQLDDFGMEISDDLDAFGQCFEEFQDSLNRYTKAMGVDEGDEKNVEGESL